VAAKMLETNCQRGRRSGHYASGRLWGTRRVLFLVKVVVHEKTVWVEEPIKVTGEDLQW
jgi:hypothetical protein